MKTLHIVYLSCFAALTAVLGLIPAIPLVAGVPITAQTLGVMLSGLILGKRLGFLSMALFCLLVSAGLPLLAGGRGGLAIIASPSGGFLLGFPIASFVIGWLCESLKFPPHFFSLFAYSILGGVIALYLIGVPWMAWRLDTTLLEAFMIALVYIPGDLIKAGLASMLALQIQKAIPLLK